MKPEKNPNAQEAAWNRFAATGSVANYLAYCETAHEQSGKQEVPNVADGDRRNHHPGTEYR